MEYFGQAGSLSVSFQRASGFAAISCASMTPPPEQERKVSASPIASNTAPHLCADRFATSGPYPVKRCQDAAANNLWRSLVVLWQATALWAREEREAQADAELLRLLLAIPRKKEISYPN